MVRQINTDGLALIKQWEAFIPNAYDDADRSHKPVEKGQHIAGTLTIGYGHTGPDVFPGQVITQEQAEQLLYKDLAPAEQAVSNLVKVELNDNQFAALVSFAFNAGIGALRSSTLLKKLNAGDYESIPSELAKWNKTTINGKKVTSGGLKNRRAAEAGLWVRGSYVASSSTPATKETPKILTPQNVAIATTFLSGGGSQLVTGDGPFQYAIASVAVVAALVAIGFFVWERVKK
jgi:lysozyme